MELPTVSMYSLFVERRVTGAGRDIMLAAKADPAIQIDSRHLLQI